MERQRELERIQQEVRIAELRRLVAALLGDDWAKASK